MIRSSFLCLEGLGARRSSSTCLLVLLSDPRIKSGRSCDGERRRLSLPLSRSPLSRSEVSNQPPSSRCRRPFDDMVLEVQRYTLPADMSVSIGPICTEYTARATYNRSATSTASREKVVRYVMVESEGVGWCWWSCSVVLGYNCPQLGESSIAESPVKCEKPPRGLLRGYF